MHQRYWESPFGNAEYDEALEMTGERDTKPGASAGTYALFDISFYGSDAI